VTVARDTVVLVPAAGRGDRLGPGAPKALRTLRGESLLVHAVRRTTAAACVGAVVVAVPAGEVEAVSAMLAALDAPADVVVVEGGATRHASVSRALDAAPSSYTIVLVHDAARCLAPASLVDAVAAAVRAGAAAVVPVVPITDTVKAVDSAGVVLETVDRAALRAAQTPQGFRRDVLAAVHVGSLDSDPTDDAGLVERAGYEVRTVPGRDEALKVTRPIDLLVAEALLEASS
jgi:2-C-methyl-D-erythritol 4-phosphate cytidylyltransferase